ncbi:MAG: RagB/SusD family nutrient uptake outer membrane protein [Bacteroides sp.]|nr:RagB/SusD family nutrient uptake outer membrane protein [Bacteroides sp.]
MKKIIYIISLLSVILFTACDDFLTVDSPSSFEKDYLFSNTEDAYKMVLGIYQLMARDEYTSRMSNVFLQNTDVEANGVNETPTGADRRDVWSLQAGLCNNWSDVTNAWNNTFKAIDRANQCIEGIEESALYQAGDATMKQLYGESKCLRAYWYWMACNYWGDVPFATTPSTADKENNTPRVSTDSIYSYLIQDLIDCEEEMKWASEGITVERMSRDFALGLIVRLSMFRAGYSMQEDGTMKRPSDYKNYLEIAIKYAQKLINSGKHTLSPDFAKIFKDQCEFTVNNDGDILYEVAFVKNGGGDVGWCIGRSVAGGSYGSGSTYICFPGNYYYSFDQRDLRRDATVSIVKYKTESKEEPASINQMNPVKWCRLWLKESPGSSSSKSTGINWPIMRYSDVLLLYAEAENELHGGPTTEAKSLLKQVRRRAFDAADHTRMVEQYVNNLSTQEDFHTAIVNERAWEFGGECLRKFDLGRWNLYGKKILETKEALTNMGKAGVGIELDNPAMAQYANLPNELYYTLVDGTSAVTGWATEMLEFANDLYTKLTDDQKPANTVSKYDDLKTNSGAYVKLNWTSSLMQTVKDEEGEDIKDADGNKIYEPADYINWTYRGYTGTTGNEPVPYLLPIPYSIVVASNGVLSNDGYGLVLQ